MFMSRGPPPKKEPLCAPLVGPPPGPQPCRPVLLLGLPDFAAAELQQVLLNDLLYAGTSRLRRDPGPLELDLWLQVLEYSSGEDLLRMTEAFGGTCRVKDVELYDANTGDVKASVLSQLGNDQRYQAIVVDDSSFIHEELVREFVVRQYRELDCSVVVMAIEGIYDIACIRQSFDVNWQFSAYTQRNVHLTDAGKRILSQNAFPFERQYTKASYILGDGEEELFAEHVDPSDYITDDSDIEDDVPPAPERGSPVVARIEDGRSVSYFAFVNSLDVSYGAIVLRLCYAAYHNAR